MTRTKWRPWLAGAVAGAIAGAVAAMLLGASGGGSAPMAGGGGSDAAQIEALRMQVGGLRNRLDQDELQIQGLQTTQPERTLSGDVLPAVPDPFASPPAPPANGADAETNMQVPGR